MPDPLKYQIEVGADTQGAEQAKEALKEIQQAAIEANEAATKAEAEAAKERIKSAKESAEAIAAEYKKIEDRAKAAAEQFSGGQSADITQVQAMLGPSFELGKQTDKNTQSVRGLKEAVRQLSQEFPLLGNVAKFALNPLVATLGLLFIAFDKLNGRIKEMAASLAPAKFEGIVNIWDKQKLAIEAMAIEMDKFWISLGRVTGEMEKMRTEADLQTAAMQRRARLADELSNADKALAKAQVDADEKAGKIDSVSAIRARKAIDDKYELLDAQNKELRQLAEIAAKDKERDAAREVPFKVASPLRAAEEKLAVTPAPEVIQAGVENARIRAEEQKKKVEATEARIKQLESGTTQGPLDIEELKALKTVIASETNARDNFRKQYEELRSNARSQIAEYNALQQEVAGYHKDIADAREANRKLTDEINALAAAYRDERAARAKITAVQKQIGDVQTKTAIGEAVKQITPEAKAAGVSAAEIFATQGVSQVQAVARAMKEQGVPASEESVKIVTDAFREIAGTVKLSTQQQKQFEAWVRQEMSTIKGQISNRGAN